MSKYSETSKKYTADYVKNNYDEIKVRTPKGKREEIQKHAAAQGISTNAFINNAIDEQIKRDLNDSQE